MVYSSYGRKTLKLLPYSLYMGNLYGFKLLSAIHPGYEIFIGNNTRECRLLILVEHTFMYVMLSFIRLHVLKQNI
jgi:hypothetical protein